MHKTLIAIVTVTALTAVGATAFAAQPSKTSSDELFLKANSTSAVAEKAEPLKGVDIKKIASATTAQSTACVASAARWEKGWTTNPNPPRERAAHRQAPPFSRATPL